jgi:hypothetical protein
MTVSSRGIFRKVMNLTSSIPPQSGLMAAYRKLNR